MSRILTLCILALVIDSGLHGQSSSYRIVLEGEVSAQQYQDSLLATQSASEMIRTWWRQGYLFAGVDSVKSSSVYLHKGEQVKDFDISFTYYDAYIDSLIELKPARSAKLWKSIDMQLDHYANNGYPFARVSLTTIQKADKWSAEMSIERGPFIEFDTLILIQNVGLGRKYLYNTLKITPGQPYSESDYEKIPDRLERLPFIEIQREPEVTFVDNGSQIYLDLQESRQSSFEGVIGFLPGQSSTNDLIVTGYLDLNLANLFKSGKGVHFSWNRFADQSQSTSISYSHPYLLSSPLFLNVDFNLLKQDTSFLNQSWQLESGTYLWKASELFFGFTSYNGTLIEPDILDLTEGIADYESKSYHIGLRSSYPELPFGIGKHFKYAVKGSIGDKSIDKNPAVMAEVYDTLELKTQRWSVTGMSRVQVPIKNQLALYHELRGQVLYNNQLLLNELTRLGGLRSIRGFNENFFYAKDFILSRLELRQYFEKRSFVMLFYDALYLQSFNANQLAQGFGLGLNLNTSNGLFTFATAVGRADDISLDFTNIKVHIGYSSRF
ncbi:hypothetical protein [Marinoscillum pacificum]|uniref:hypothetical protein n=1 Tax=Marinoscillum pacificum TaxID=392723 RepID=UPI00215855FC|nr:hypothetical protein [Marinoscillum pacificum]